LALVPLGRPTPWRVEHERVSLRPGGVPRAEQEPGPRALLPRVVEGRLQPDVRPGGDARQDGDISGAPPFLAEGELAALDPDAMVVGREHAGEAGERGL